VSKVTLIIPTYNAMQFLNYCLLSLIRQQNKDFNIVFVDDCSIDGTPLFLKKLFAENKNVVVTSTAVNSGPAAARNTGIQFVETPYFSFLDPDDAISANYIDSVNSALQLFPEKAVYASTIHTKDIFQTLQSEDCIQTNKSPAFEKSWTPTDINRLIFSTNIVKQNPQINFDVDLRNFEGELFCLKYFNVVSNQIVVLPTAFHVHFHRPGSLTKQNSKNRFRNSLPILEKYKNTFKDELSNQKIETWIKQTKSWI